MLEKIIGAFELVQRDYIRLELVKAYLTMLNECSDRAALKITMVSRKFFICLLEQIRLICLTNSTSALIRKTSMGKTISNTKSADNSQLDQEEDNGNEDLSIKFLHEFVRIVLNLLKNLLENSQSVKDVFADCSCYDLLYEILKDCPSDCMDIEISMLINEMVNTILVTYSAH